MDAVHEETFANGVVGKLYREDDPDIANPRDQDNLTVMASWTRDWSTDEEWRGEDDFTAVCARCGGSGDDPDDESVVCLPCDGFGVVNVTGVEHAKRAHNAIWAVGLRFDDYGSRGVQLYITDDDDEGMNGVAYVTKARCIELGIPGDGDDLEEVEHQAKTEIAEYTKWFEGDVWFAVVEDEHGETLASCGGFIGYDYALEELRRMGRFGAEEVAQERAEAEYWLLRDVETV